jgi:hypothetical protein
MGLFICEMCDEHSGLDNARTHICKLDNIKKHFRELKERALLAENKLSEIRDAIFNLLKSLPTLENEIVVDAEWLTKLWDAAECQFWDSKTANSFHACWMAQQSVLCEAYDVFRSTKYGHSQTLLQKLIDLKKACDDSAKVLGYKESFDMTPIDLVENG